MISPMFWRSTCWSRTRTRSDALESADGETLALCSPADCALTDVLGFLINVR